jgi:hypothetical protein
MREGELENHVMVILSGWTQVSVHELGSERVIAERGPGQLVGERAALRVNARSATVIALEKVRALVMKTEDFAGFISDHPRVLDIVESQIYGRLIEGPAGHGRDGWPDTFPSGPMAHPSAEGRRQHLPAGENCTVLLTDVVGFGAHHRNDQMAGSQVGQPGPPGRAWQEGGLLGPRRTGRAGCRGLCSSGVCSVRSGRPGRVPSGRCCGTCCPCRAWTCRRKTGRPG